MYVDVRFVVGTNNACERLFSRGKRILTDARGAMKPFTFEALLYLKVHEDLWGQVEVTRAMRMNLDDCYKTPAPGSGATPRSTAAADEATGEDLESEEEDNLFEK
jgi:hypothetical protein